MLINNLSDFDPVYELCEYEPNKLVCRLEIPNLKKESLDIEIVRDNHHILVVNGEKEESLKDEKILGNSKIKIHSGDIKKGKFQKWIQIGNLIDVIDFESNEDDEARLSYENGVLSIFLVRINNGMRK